MTPYKPNQGFWRHSFLGFLEVFISWFEIRGNISEGDGVVGFQMEISNKDANKEESAMDSKRVGRGGIGVPRDAQTQRAGQKKQTIILLTEKDWQGHKCKKFERTEL